MYIITISNLETHEYFFTTKHCQPHNLGPDWVSCSARIPMHVVPRKGVEDGVISTVAQYNEVFNSDMKEILNPQPEYQA